MGQYFTLKITIELSELFETKIINFFGKIPPPNDSPQYEFGIEQGSFKKEIDIYTKLFPKIINELNKLKYIPECFFGIDENIIVLDDMSINGYNMSDKIIPFDFNHCYLIIKTLAEFHANSIIYEELNKKNIYDEFSYCLHETLWPTLLGEGRAKRMFDAAVKGTISMIDLIESFNNDDRIKFKNKFIKLSVNHCQTLKPSVKYRNVVCHGDLWTNNILFKYNNKKQPTDCCFIDFQLARYNPPAHDILTFLYFTTTKKLRDKHMNDLLKIYYDKLSSLLENAGLNSSIIFPKNEFINSIEDLKLNNMMHAALNIPIMLLDPNEASKYFKNQPKLLDDVLYIDRTPMVCGQFKDLNTYKQRMSDSLLELYNNIQ